MDLDLAQLRALSAAVAEGTFEAAARALHITPSAVSQRIRALEVAVGRVLLERSKPVRVTTSGAAVLRLARNIDLLTSDARVELGSDGDGVTSIPIAVNADSLATWILPALATLPATLVFDLHLDDQDHTAGLLRDGTVMGAVTALRAPVQGCTSTPLGAMRYRVTASPAFAARWFADGVTPAALAIAPVVVFDRKDDLQHAYLRRRAHRALHPPIQRVPSSVDFVSAVRLGLGWGMVPDLQSDGDDGLVDLDPASAVDVVLYWQQWQLRSPSLDLLAGAIRDAAAEALR
jgi:LysR family transcriptional regulator (chromosome initiation inhibitor)